MQMAASGYLLQVLSGGLVPWVFAMWALGALVFLYVGLGGMRAAAFVGVLQALLFGAVTVAVGVIAWVELGGFGGFVDLLAKLGASKVGEWGASSTGINAMFATPGVVQFVAGLARRSPSEACGRRDGPVVRPLADGLAARAGLRARPFRRATHEVSRRSRCGSPRRIGFGLVFFGVIAGVGALFLGASPSVNQALAGGRTDPPGAGDGHEAGLIA